MNQPEEEAADADHLSTTRSTRCSPARRTGAAGRAGQVRGAPGAGHIDGQPYVVKHLDHEADWTLRVAYVPGSATVELWRHGVLAELPDCFNQPIVAVAQDVRRPDGLRPAHARRRQVAGPGHRRADPGRAARAVPRPHGRAARHLLGAGGSTSSRRRDRYLELSPRMAAAEAALGSDHLVPRLVAQGWPLLEEVAPALARVVVPLAHDPSPLVDALATTPADLRARQLEARQPRHRRRRADRAPRLGAARARARRPATWRGTSRSTAAGSPRRRRTRSRPTGRRSSATASTPRRGGTASSASACSARWSSSAGRRRSAGTTTSSPGGRSRSCGRRRCWSRHGAERARRGLRRRGRRLARRAGADVRPAGRGPGRPRPGRGWSGARVLDVGAGTGVAGTVRAAPRRAPGGRGRPGARHAAPRPPALSAVGDLTRGCRSPDDAFDLARPRSRSTTSPTRPRRWRELRRVAPARWSPPPSHRSGTTRRRRPSTG